MEIKKITSESNEIIKSIKALKQKKQRMKSLQFTIEGLRIVDECLKHGGDVAYIVYSEDFHSLQGSQDVLAMIYERGYPVYEVPSQLFNKIGATETPQGILAVVNMKESTLGDFDFNGEKDLFFVILDRIQDPGNMGTIIRTAESAKVDGIIVTKGSVDPYNSKTLRATMGAVFHLPIIQVEDDEWVDYLKDHQVKLVAADLDTENTYIDIDYKGSIGIIVGNEANGIDPLLLDHVDERVIIPILGKIESLNASIAAGILIYKVAEEKHFRKF